MILHYASQADYDGMSGKDNAVGRAWTPEEVAGLGEYMGKWTNELVESGEFVDAAALAGPVHTRRVGPGDLVTDGPFAETAEVVVGYTIVDCAGLDRATEIAAKLGDGPVPDYVRTRAFADVRPLMSGLDELSA
ncbi:YciI family protein [Actinophytocola sp.]|uniref:YciI family protein n=1 Tax=Actinophytocola sp. TaxID=1872138 RepID=UPI003899ECA7